MGMPQTVAALSREDFIAWENAQPDKHDFATGLDTVFEDV